MCTFKRLVVSFSVILACLLISASGWCASGTLTFIENFATQNNRDVANTTAEWANGYSVLRTAVTGVSTQNGYSMARDNSGNIVAVWNDNRAGANYVYAAKYSSTGSKIWGDTQIVAGLFPRISSDGSNFYISYVNGSNYLIVRKLDTNGNALWTSGRVDSASYPVEMAWLAHDIGTDTSGNSYVAYTLYGPYGATGAISKLNTSGTLLWGPLSANTVSSSSYAIDVSIAVNGSYVYVSHRDAAPGSLDICRINPTTGAKVWAADLIVDTGGKIRIVAESSGNVCAVYTNSFSVMYKKYNPSQTLLYGPATLKSGVMYVDAKEPEIAIDASNNKYVVWSDRFAGPLGYDYRVKGQKLNASDAVQWTADGVQLCHDDLYEQGIPDVSPTSTGGLFGIWQCSENFSNQTIWANIASSAGVKSFTDDMCIHNAPEYAASSQGQSITLDAVTENVTATTLEYNTVPDSSFDNTDAFGVTHTLYGQSVAFYLTNNGGTNWYAVTPGTKYTFPVQGSDLRFRVVLSAGNRSLQPRVNDLKITYDYADAPSGDTTAPTGSPSTPTDQGVYAPGSALTFTWTIGTSTDPESGITGYYLQVASDTGFTNIRYAGDVGNVTSYTVSGCSQGLTYYARVRAKNGANLYSSYSGTSDGIMVDMTIPTGAPSTPTDAGATTTSTALTFNWTIGTAADPESGIAGYNLQVASDTGFTNLIYNADVGNVTSYSVSGAVVGSTYYARVRAKDGAFMYSVYSAASDGIQVVTGDTTPPTGAPSVPTDAGVYSPTVNLTFNWAVGTAADPESGISGYYLQVASDTGFTAILFNGDVGNVTSYTVAGVQAATYYARVRAKNGYNLYGSYSGASNGIKIDNTPPAGFTTPTDQGVTTTSASLTFNWTVGTVSDPESGVAGYQLWVSTDQNFMGSAGTLFNAIVGNVMTYTVPGAVVGSTYYAKVSALNNAGTSGSYFGGTSDGITVVAADTTAPTGTPSVPTDEGTYKNGSTLIFNWTLGTSADPETGIAGYYLQIATDTGFTSLIYNSDVGNVLTYTLSGCTQGTIYYARVRAKNGQALYGSYSGASNGIRIDTTAPSGVPSIPVDQGAVSTTTSTSFSWTAGTAADAESGIAGYYLQVATDTGFTNLLVNADVGNVTSYTATGCVNGSTYYARARAKNGVGLYGSYSAASDGILIQLPDTTSPAGMPSTPVDEGVYKNGTSLVFSWTIGTSSDPESGIAGYYLQVATDVGFTNLLYNADAGNVLTYTVSGCLQGSTYYARVRAKNGQGLYGSYSGTSDGIKIDATAPTGAPGMPTDEGAYKNGTSVIFTWTAGTSADAESGLTGYYLQVASDAGFASLVYNADVGNVLTYTASGCVQGTTYYARVRTKNGVSLYSGYSAASDGIKIDMTAPTGTPSAPGDQGAVSAATSTSFNWTIGTAVDAESGITGYYLQVASDTGFANLIYNAEVGNVLTYTVTGCVNGSTYYARVRAKNGIGLYSGYSGASDGILIQLPDTTAPTGTPSVPTDEGVYKNGTSLTFNWAAGTSADPESGIAGYYLQVASDTGFTNLLYNADAGNVLTYTVSGGVQGNTYYARVRAKNGGGLYGSYSGSSDGIRIDTTAPAGAPATPTDQGATSAITTLTFNWGIGTTADAESSIAGYYLQVARDTGFTNLVFNADVGNVTAYAVLNCTSGSTYYARVRAKNGVGLYSSYSGVSDGILVQTGDTTPPTGVPTTPTDQGYYSGSGSVLLNWTAGTSADPETGIAGYYLQVASDTGFTSLLYSGDVGNVLTYTVTGGLQNVTYYARIRAKNGAGLYGTYSGTSDGIRVDLTGPSGTPGSPNDQGAAINSTSLVFNWTAGTAADADSGIANYYLEVANNPSFTSPSFGQDVGNVTSYTVNGCAQGGKYYAHVRAKNGAGVYGSYSTASDGIIVDITVPTGVPSAPVDQGDTIGSTNLLFTWTAGTAADAESGISGYILQVATEPGFTTLVFNSDVGNVLSYTLTGCSYNMTYYARLRARNGAGLYSSFSGGSNGIMPIPPSNVPYVLYTDTAWVKPLSGWMGSNGGNSLSVAQADTTSPAQGISCTKITYDKTKETWAGIFCQYNGSWTGSGVDLTNNRRLTLKAKASVNGAIVHFGMGADASSDTAKKEVIAALTTSWQQIDIDLSGLNLTSINGLWYFSITASDNAALASPVTFYVDDVRYDDTIPTVPSNVPYNLYLDSSWTRALSGYMGTSNGISLAVAPGDITSPYQGSTCTKITYDMTKETWAGIYCQNNGWAGAGVDLTGNKRMTFMAKASVSGTVVKFGFGSGGDTASASTTVTLGTAWQRVEIDLTGKNLTSINGLWFFTVSASDNAAIANPVTFYVDEVKYDDTAVAPPSNIPYLLYGDTAWTQPLSGWMGQAGGNSLTLNLSSTTSPATGTTCTSISYNKTAETWAGVYSMVNGWSGPGIDLTGNVKLTFKARGSVAGIKVKFGMGASSSSDTTIKDLPGSPVTLSTTWTTYTVDLAGANLTKINGLWYFAITAADNSALANPVVFYVDDVTYSN
jgi:hypothetical protein